jgi:ADP-ribosylglycohydrolase
VARSAEPDVKADRARARRAHASLIGLSIGDALGERFFGEPDEVRGRIALRQLPEDRPWRWTDDTQMAVSVYRGLCDHGRVHPRKLALRFAASFDMARGYGWATRELLLNPSYPSDPHAIAAAAFAGAGSRGSGAAMRVAPLGAFFADDQERVIAEARTQALLTHAHPDAADGAVAVALAAAFSATRHTGGAGLLTDVAAVLPDGPMAEALSYAGSIGGEMTPEDVGAALGTGFEATALDTVPFALWNAAHHLGSFVDCFWSTVAGLGDRDTTCAMACGVVAASLGHDGIPQEWANAVEPVPVPVPS